MPFNVLMIISIIPMPVFKVKQALDSIDNFENSYVLF
tara:strand:- start:448 stop:558 length:111 start_codon:yes stop_codon:yes gene_type:complete